MITEAIFTEMALSLPGSEQVPHFERTGFKIEGRKMFATYLADDNTANIFLTPEEQAVFCQLAPGHIYPVANKWGEKGATTFVLHKLERDVVMEALVSAYNDVLTSGKPKKPRGKQTGKAGL